MKFLDEYRDPGHIHALARELKRITTRPHTVMEVCGGQTHAFLRFGLEALLPESLTLVHGPGCPVCVTPIEHIDMALEIAARPEVIFTTFGDMLRVPGSNGDLQRIRASGGDVRMVYSPLDAVHLAQAHPTREVVFFGIGFETTAPAVAMAIHQARRLDLRNFSVLLAHVLVPPAMEAVLSAADNKIEGFLAAGHVSAVMGMEAYYPLVKRYRVPIVVTGFEPVDLLEGLRRCVLQLEEGRAEVENAYARVVPSEGNRAAQALIAEIFQVVGQNWRGFGPLPLSGLALRPAYANLNALERFGLQFQPVTERGECISGQILQGLKKPRECPAFGVRCTPESPLGATMVSSEGACAAYFKYQA